MVFETAKPRRTPKHTSVLKIHCTFWKTTFHWTPSNMKKKKKVIVNYFLVLHSFRFESYYLENQLKKPLTRIFKPVLPDLKVLFEGDHTRSIAVVVPKTGKNRKNEKFFHLHNTKKKRWYCWLCKAASHLFALQDGASKRVLDCLSELHRQGAPHLSKTAAGFCFSFFKGFY